MTSSEVFRLLASFCGSNKKAYLNQLNERLVEQLLQEASQEFHPPLKLLTREHVPEAPQIERTFVMWHITRCKECAGILNSGDVYPQEKIAGRTESWKIAQAIIDRMNDFQKENYPKLIASAVKGVSEELGR